MSDLFSEMRSQARKKGVSVRDIFTDCDLKHEGKLTKNLFRRAFVYLGVWIPDARFNDVAQIYATDDGGVDYKRFVSDFEKSSTTKTIVTTEQLQAFAKPLIERNRTVSEMLQDLDKHHMGRVPFEKFCDIFGHTDLTRKIAQHYANPPYNEITYLDLERDIAYALNMAPVQQDTLQRAPKFIMEVAKAMRLKGIDPYRVLGNLDKFKKKVILSSQFLSLIGTWGLNLRPQQLQELTDAYSDGRNFRYLEFCDAITRAQQIEAEETSQKEIEFGKTKRVQVDVADTLKKVEEEVVARHAHIGRAFEQVDQEGEGKLSPRAFRSTLEQTRFRSLGKNELDAVCDEFVGDDNKVNYEEFVMAVSPPRKPLTKETADILDRLRKYLVDKRLRLRPMMEKLDPEKKGTIGWQQLLACLRNISFDINMTERKILRARTSLDVNINEFCSEVDPAPEAPKPPEPEEEEEEPEAPPKEVLDALARVSSVSTKFDLDLLDELRRYEPAPTRIFRKTSMESALHTLPVPLSPADVEVLANYYSDAKGESVNGYKFVKDVESYGNDQLKLTPTLSLTQTAEERPIDDDTHTVMRRLKAHLDAKDLNGYQLFRPYDQHRTGCIPTDRFHAILTFIQFPISKEDERKICYVFAAQKMPEQINYKKLLNVLYAESVTKADLSSSMIPRTTTNSGEHELISIINTIHNKLRERHRSPLSAFAGCSDAPIPVAEFKERIGTYNLLITAQDMLIIVRKYRTNLAGDIDWRAFCEDVETTKTVQSPR